MIDPGLSKEAYEAFKVYPAIGSLMVVIWWLIRFMVKKDAASDSTIKNFLDITKGDAERGSRMLALLEILVARGDKHENN